jgi:hypothetical protein
MMTPWMLTMLDATFKNSPQMDASLAFGGLNILLAGIVRANQLILVCSSFQHVLLGDTFQLPAVRSPPIEKWSSSTAAGVLWHGFDRVVMLVDNYRAKDDPASAAVLARLRYGSLNDDAITTINQQCYQSRDKPIEHVVGTHQPVICQKNNERHTFNRQQQKAAIDIEAQRRQSASSTTSRLLVVDATIEPVFLCLRVLFVLFLIVDLLYVGKNRHRSVARATFSRVSNARFAKNVAFVAAIVVVRWSMGDYHTQRRAIIGRCEWRRWSNRWLGCARE